MAITRAWTERWAGVALGLLICVSLATAQDRPDQGRASPPSPISRGFVFIDGQYLPPPYTVAATENGATINGQAIMLDRVGQSPSGAPMFTNAGPWNARQEEPRQREHGGDRERRARRGPPAEWGQHRRIDPVAKLRRELDENLVLVSFADRPVVALPSRASEELLRLALRDDDTPMRIKMVMDALPPSADFEQWRTWLTSYQAQEPLVSNASYIVTQLETIEADNLATIVANRRLHDWAYPLTVFGMVMGVVSLGHLLKSPPKAPTLKVSDEERDLLIKASIFSLGLVVVLSLLDLVWTILAANAGQMHEVNPIGNHLIENPVLLSAFKIGATVMSCSILLMLRRHLRAQWAAWWLCLICTVLTFRWLVLNSMFVT